MRMPITLIGFEAERFPERDASRCGIDGYNLSSSTPRMLKQCGGQHAADTGSAVTRADVEAAHPQSGRENWINR